MFSAACTAKLNLDTTVLTLARYLKQTFLSARFHPNTRRAVLVLKKGTYKIF